MRLAAGRMSTLLSDLLDFSRVNTRGLKLTDIDLSEKIANVLDDIETAIERTGANISIVEPLPKIRADAIQMRQLFQNLITNAIKFQAPGSTAAVEIRGELVDIDGDKYARLVIADNGIGFEERYLDRIFAPFQRLHDRAEFAGTGIGLAICRRICERHGGSISATSELGRGSEFTVTLAVNPANEVDTDLDTNEAD
jgi:signal transduction histidine kinase